MSNLATNNNVDNHLIKLPQRSIPRPQTSVSAHRDSETEDILQLITNQGQALEGMKQAQKQSNEIQSQLEHEIQLKRLEVEKQSETISQLKQEVLELKSELIFVLENAQSDEEARKTKQDLFDAQKLIFQNRQEIQQLKQEKQTYFEKIQELEAQEKAQTEKPNNGKLTNDMEYRHQVLSLEKQVQRLQAELEMKHIELKKTNQLLRMNVSKSPHPTDVRGPSVRTRTQTQGQLQGLSELPREKTQLRSQSPLSNVFSHLDFQKVPYKENRTVTPNRLPTLMMPQSKFVIEPLISQRTTQITTNRGRQSYQNGEHYEGELVNGMRHGYGLLKDRDGDELYAGYWANDVMQGSGMLKNKRAQLTVIDFKRLVINDQNWAQYSGQLLNGRFSGVGNLLFTNQDRYQGSFLDGTPHGTGTFIRHKGEHIRGHWNNGIFHEKK